MRWNLSKKEPSLENILTGLGLEDEVLDDGAGVDEDD